MASARSAEILPKEQLVCTPEARVSTHLNTHLQQQFHNCPQHSWQSLSCRVLQEGGKAPHLETLHLPVATGALPPRIGFVMCLSYAPELYTVAQHYPRDP